MISHLKHILSVFIFLSLLGIGERLPFPVSSVRPVKETEWVISAGSSEKLSKCCHYIQYYFNSSKCLILKPWSEEFNRYYHQKVKVQVTSGIKIQHIVTSKKLVFTKLYNAKRSIEDYPVS